MRTALLLHVLILLSTFSCNRISEIDYADSIQVRDKPIVDFKVFDTIRVRDFGAFVNDSLIDTRQIQEAIDSAVSLESAIMILFEKGIYRLDALGTRNALEISGASDIIFEGNGASFMMVRPEILMMPVRNSKRIILRNFSVDYEISPFTQGWVTEVNPEELWLKVRIEPGWPSPGRKNFRDADYKWAFIKDKDNLPAFKEGTEFRLYLADWEETEKGTWKYHVRYASKLLSIEPGDPFVQISRVDGCLLSASNSEDITLHRLRLYQSPACMLGSGNTSRMNYLEINMSPLEGRWMSAGADGCFNVNGREGPWIEGCTFNALGDDNLVIGPGY